MRLSGWDKAELAVHRSWGRGLGGCAALAEAWRGGAGSGWAGQGVSVAPSREYCPVPRRVHRSPSRPQSALYRPAPARS